MKTQLKLAATVALTALGFAAATPALAIPSSALEFSQQTYTFPGSQPAKQRVTLAQAARTTVVAGPTREPISD